MTYYYVVSVEPEPSLPIAVTQEAVKRAVENALRLHLLNVATHVTFLREEDTP